MSIALRVVLAHGGLERVGGPGGQLRAVGGPQPVTVKARRRDRVIRHPCPLPLGRVFGPACVPRGDGLAVAQLGLLDPAVRGGQSAFGRADLRLGRQAGIRHRAPTRRQAGGERARLGRALVGHAGKVAQVERQGPERVQRIRKGVGAVRHALGLAQVGLRLGQRERRVRVAARGGADVLCRLAQRGDNRLRQHQLRGIGFGAREDHCHPARIGAGLVAFGRSTRHVGGGRDGAGDQGFAIVEPRGFERLEHVPHLDARRIRCRAGELVGDRLAPTLGLGARRLGTGRGLDRQPDLRRGVRRQIRTLGVRGQRLLRLLHLAPQGAAGIRRLAQRKRATRVVPQAVGVGTGPIAGIHVPAQRLEAPRVQPRLGECRTDLHQPGLRLGQRRAAPARLVEGVDLGLCLLQQRGVPRQPRGPGVEQLAQFALGLRDLLAAAT